MIVDEASDVQVLGWGFKLSDLTLCSSVRKETRTWGLMVVEEQWRTQKILQPLQQNYNKKGKDNITKKT
jgi:hypothetical protein